MSVIIPIVFTILAALWAAVEYNRRPYWSLMPGYATVIACTVSVVVWAAWLLVAIT
jgi:hypothetical protein